MVRLWGRSDPANTGCRDLQDNPSEAVLLLWTWRRNTQLSPEGKGSWYLSPPLNPENRKLEQGSISRATTGSCVSVRIP